MGKIWAGLGFIFTLVSIYLTSVLVPAWSHWRAIQIPTVRTNATIERCIEAIANPNPVFAKPEVPPNPEDCAPRALARQARSEDFFASGPSQEVFTLLAAVLFAAGFFYLYKRSLNSAK